MIITPSLIKKVSIIIAIIIVALALILTGSHYFLSLWRAEHVDTEQLLAEAFANTDKVTSYSFDTSATLLLENNSEAKTNIKGERADDENFRIKGSLLDTETEIYQLGDTNYHYNSYTGQWTKTEKSPLPDNVFVKAAADPLFNFADSSFVDSEYLGYTRSKTAVFYQFRFYADDTQDILGEFFSDITYTITINSETKAITTIIVTASSDTSAVEFTQTSKIYKQNETTPLKPPKN